MEVFDMFEEKDDKTVAEEEKNISNNLLNDEDEKEISEEEKEELIKTLPTFEYHPNIYKNAIVEFKNGICNCCGKEVKAYVSFMYSREHVNCICMNCIKDGSAAKKFDGTFIERAEKIDDEEKKEILAHRTPGYCSWQGEFWLACCNDYCKFIGDVGTKELEELGVADEVIKEYAEKFKDDPDYIKENLVANGWLAGYLFRCKHCKKYHLYVDMD